MSSQERWCVVTGGRGFAARHLVEMLISYEMYCVRIADLAPSIRLEQYEEEGPLGKALKVGRAQYVSADLRDKTQVLKAFQGAEVVFHMAAPDSSINNYNLQRSVNVEGTKNVIESCVALQVNRLIYTSSPSVVFDGVHGIINGDESLSYPVKHNDFYSATKAEGEALVLKANGEKGLLTCCIRPSSIFGPGDRLLVPSLVTAARAGKSKFIIGDGNNMYDFTYVGNVAHAHICAERALASKGPVAEKASGQAYFITNMEPIKFWDFMSIILEGLGYERPRIKIPAVVMMPIAHLVEFIYRILAPYGMKVPQLTPSRIRLLSCDRTFSCSKAVDRLGYSPIVSLQEGLEKTIESYSHLRAEQQPRKDRQSKIHRYLGGGRVADVLLWKDEKQSLATILILLAFYYNFVASGYSMIATICKLFLLVAVFLYIHANLPERIFGCTIEKVPVSAFHCSVEKTNRAALSVVTQWNTAVDVFKTLCRGGDWMLFLKVAVALVIVGLLSAISFQRLYLSGILIMFSAFYIYDKKEDEIDGIISRITNSRSTPKSE
ncbi:3beta-hydroxysteroid-dehydrogenase/decarboxylase-like [Silene latifolia]|uniref:3beta-hydroxysteroid- dehydrogenase/decarboxylase-like n=1 Tax=Silene latifolia TaxID=37657 RepID=UPI003D781FA8